VNSGSILNRECLGDYAAHRIPAYTLDAKGFHDLGDVSIFRQNVGHTCVFCNLRGKTSSCLLFIQERPQRISLSDRYPARKTVANLGFSLPIHQLALLRE
jgi:hypothetical protein